MTTQLTITWYTTSPDAGDPDCLCSLPTCGQPILEDEVPVRVFDEENDREARFHPDCFETFLALTMATPANPITPPDDWAAGSRPPFERGGWSEDAYNDGALPFYWADETTDLPAAVRAYLDNIATPQQLSRVGQYLGYYIQAPCWSGGADLDDLRRRAAGLNTAEAINAWLEDCLKIGLDPL